MHKKKFILLNPFFFVPFLAWIVVGGFVLWSYNKLDLFTSINTRCYNTADVIMYYVTILGQAEIIIPILVFLMIIPAFRTWWYFVTALLCNLVPFLLQHFIKTWLNFPRPMLLIHDTAKIHCLPRWPVLLHSSFPSGHSQGAFSFFCFLSLLLPSKYRWWGIVFFLLALSVCYSRIYLAAHFFEDVYAGSVLGTLVTTIVFSVMYRYKDIFLTRKTAVS